MYLKYPDNCIILHSENLFLFKILLQIFEMIANGGFPYYRHYCKYPSCLSMEFSRPEYWSGQPFPSPEEFPNPGIKLRSPALQPDSSEPPGKPIQFVTVCSSLYFPHSHPYFQRRSIKKKKKHTEIFQAKYFPLCYLSYANINVKYLAICQVTSNKL